MLFDIFRNGFSTELLISLCARLFVLFCVLPIHEFAHALVATKLGDKTAKYSGRLTINPLAHLDLIGSLMIIFAGFGYAKPVPVNPRNFKNPKGGMALTAFAGPLSNFIMAFIFTFLHVLFRYKIGGTYQSDAVYLLSIFFLYSAQVNITLGVFNFLPIPPLDGSKILAIFIPNRLYYNYMRYERYIALVLLFLIIFGVLDKPIAIVSGFFSGIFANLSGLVLGL